MNPTTLDTSPEIIDACIFLANGDEQEALKIWAAPTNEQFIAIWKIVTNDGMRDATGYRWGSEGYDWARTAQDGAR